MFGLGRGFKSYSPNNDYSPYVRGTNVHLRMCCTCVLVTILAMTCVVVNNGIISSITTTSHQTLHHVFPVNHFMHPPLVNTVHMNPLLHGIIYSTTTIILQLLVETTTPVSRRGIKPRPYHRQR